MTITIKYKRPARRSPLATAQLILLNARSYADEKQREVSRYRFSADALKRFSNRQRLHDGFLNDVDDELFGLGWIFARRSESEFAVIDDAKTTAWPKLGPKRLKESGLLAKDDEAIDDEYWKLFPPSDFDENDVE
ncbi:hypothetical protein [Caballeronia sp. 15711]|uniref:hypothetical protein n=1 Tax=Caballeronia sp. 15711 TaxID=3391029 RepID=UPI0039E627F7